MYFIKVLFIIIFLIGIYLVIITYVKAKNDIVSPYNSVTSQYIDMFSNNDKWLEYQT